MKVLKLKGEVKRGIKIRRWETKETKDKNHFALQLSFSLLRAVTLVFFTVGNEYNLTSVVVWKRALT